MEKLVIIENIPADHKKNRSIDRSVNQNIQESNLSRSSPHDSIHMDSKINLTLLGRPQQRSNPKRVNMDNTNSITKPHAYDRLDTSHQDRIRSPQ